MHKHTKNWWCCVTSSKWKMCMSLELRKCQDWIALSCLAGRITETLELFLQKMENSFSYNAALGYKQRSLSIQKVDGKMFIKTEVCPQAGDTILHLGWACWTRVKSCICWSSLRTNSIGSAVLQWYQESLICGRKRFKLPGDWILIMRHYFQQLCRPLDPTGSLWPLQ